MREIRKSGSEGGARQTNVSFLPLSSENFSPSLGVSVRGFRQGDPQQLHQQSLRQTQER